MPDLYFGATEEATEAERTAVAEAIAGFGAVTIRETERLVHAGRGRVVNENRRLLAVSVGTLAAAAARTPRKLFPGRPPTPS